MANSLVYEFPYSPYHPHSIPYINNDVNLLASQITHPLDGLLYNQPPVITLQCVPQINSTIGGNASVYHVPESVPLEAILREFGVDMNTLQLGSSLNNYSASVFQPVEISIPGTSRRPKRLICREVSDTEDDLYFRRPLRRSNSWSNQSQQPPGAIHDVLSRVWDKAKTAASQLPPSHSAPNLNSVWESMRNAPPLSNPSVNNVWQHIRNSPTPPPLPNPSVNNVWQHIRNSPTPFPDSSISNAWQAMVNAPPGISREHQNAVSNVWNRADNASHQNSSPVANAFHRMQQATSGVPPPSPLNREAVHDFFAARNVPPGINQPSPFQNREAVHDFLAARNVPPGINQPSPFQNREAVHDFLAARNVPAGINQLPPFQNREAAHDFLAARNALSGGNQLIPQQNREAVRNFLAARNLPVGMNQPNSAVASVWQKADYAAHQNPYPQQQFYPSQPPISNVWNRMQQNMPYSPMAAPRRSLQSIPAPMSFSSVLSQAHRQHLPFSGAM